ncbi:MAG: hypothetical protein ACYSR9_06455 [Planctomycetota bacterium]|jgi:hypothetical protein
MNAHLHSGSFDAEVSQDRLSLGALLSNGASVWNFSQRKLILMWLIPVLIVGIAAVSALMGKEMYKLFTGEGQIAETLQVIFYAAAFVLNLNIIRLLSKDGQKVIAPLYIIVCIGLFFMIGEELNWGQQIIRWETAESWKAINKQKETNLHNIYGVGYAFKWLQLVVGAYGTILPLLVGGFTMFKRFESRLSFIIPHYTLVPFFMPLFVWRIYRNFLEPPKKYYFAISEFNEVMELILAIGMVLFMIFQYRRLKTKQTAQVLSNG